MKNQIITVDLANQIQDQWMALEHTATDAEKHRIFALMDLCPKCYLSVKDDGQLATVIYQGQPLNIPISISECLSIWGAKCNIDRTMAWQNCKWVPFSELQMTVTA